MINLFEPYLKEEIALPKLGFWVPMSNSVKDAIARLDSLPDNVPKLSELMLESPPVKKISAYLKY